MKLKIIQNLHSVHLILSTTVYYTYINVHKNFKCNIDLLFSTLNICDKIDTVVYDET